MKGKSRRNPHLYDISLGALASSLAVILSFIGIQMPMGGKLSLEMLPLLLASLISFRAGLLSGIIFGIIKVFLEAVPVVHPIQFILDYPLAFSVLSVAWFFRRRYLLGSLIAISLRYLIHVISGAIFFASYAKGNPWVYSLIYNALYMLPSALGVLIFLYLIYPKLKLQVDYLDG